MNVGFPPYPYPQSLLGDRLTRKILDLSLQLADVEEAHVDEAEGANSTETGNARGEDEEDEEEWGPKSSEPFAPDMDVEGEGAVNSGTRKSAWRGFKAKAKAIFAPPPDE